MKLVPQGSVRKSAVSVACLALTGSYLVHTHAYAPRIEEVRRGEARLGVLMDGKRQRDDHPVPDRDGLERRLASYESLIDQLEALVPSGEEVPALMEEVAAQQRHAGVEMTMFRPEPPEEHETYQLWSYRLAVRGSYHAIGSFITAIGSLARVVAADDMIIAAEQTAPVSAGPEEVTVVASFRILLRVKGTERGRSPEPINRM